MRNKSLLLVSAFLLVSFFLLSTPVLAECNPLNPVSAENPCTLMQRAEEFASFGLWVYQVDTQTLTSSYGTRLITGLDPEQNINLQQIRSLVLPEYHEPLIQQFEQLIANGTHVNTEFRILLPTDDSIHHIHLTADYDANQNTTFGMLHDFTSEAYARHILKRRTIIFNIAISIIVLFQLGIIIKLILTSKQRRLAEEQAQKTIQERDLLLREVHHRIKNNMATVVNLLTLQAATTTNKETIASLENARTRVQSMMLIYERLYRSKNYQQVSIKEYLENLVDEIRNTYPQSAAIMIETDVQDFPLEPDVLFHLGILINELITNSIKYAFPQGEGGLIRVYGRCFEKQIQIVIQDTGCGIPDSVDLSAPSGFGLSLVQILAEQIGAELKLERKNGTSFCITFGSCT